MHKNVRLPIAYHVIGHPDVIYSQIMNHLDSHHIPVEFQHGLRSNHSCETQLLNTVEDLSRRPHARIQKFSSGPGQSLAYFTEVNWLISKKTIIFQGSRGGPTFSRGGSNFFQGVQLLIPYRNPYNL